MNLATDQYAGGSGPPDPDMSVTNGRQSFNGKMSGAGSTKHVTGALKTEAKSTIRYFDHVDTLLHLDQELVVDPEEAVAFLDRVEEQFGYPVSSQEIIETIQVLEPGNLSLSATVAALEVRRIAAALLISAESAAHLSGLIDAHLAITTNNRALLQLLSELPGKPHYLSQLIWLLRLSELLDVGPREAQLFCRQVSSALGDDVDDDEVLRAVNDLNPKERHVEAIAWRIRVNRFEKIVGPLKKGQSQQLLQAVDRHLPSRATTLEIFRALGTGREKDTTVDELAERIAADRIARRLDSDQAGAAGFLEAVNAEGDYHHRPCQVLVALLQLELIQQPDQQSRPEPDDVASLLQIARLLGIEVSAAGQFYDDVQSSTENETSLVEVARALKEIGESERSSESVAAFVEVSQILARVLPGDRTADIQLWLQQELRRPVSYQEIRKRMGGVYEQELSIPDRQLTEASFMTALKLTCLLETDMAAVIELKKEAARRSGRRLTFDVLMQIMRTASRENCQLPRAVDYVALARIFNIASRDYSELNFVLNRLVWEPERLDAFWRLVSRTSIKRRLRIQDLRHLQELATLPPAGLRGLEPDDQMANWITKAYVDKREVLLDRRLNRPAIRSVTNTGAAFGQQVESLRDYRATLWAELNGDRRLYPVPSEGRAEIEASDFLYELIGLESVRFVGEGILAPAVHIQFRFGNTLGVVWLGADGQVQGFHHISDDELFRTLVEAVALAYYRDLILPDKAMILGSIDAAANQPFLTTADPQWRGQRWRRNRANFGLEEWYDAQERARRYVKGHAPRLNTGLIAGTAQLAESWAHGFVRKQGKAWVFDRERGEPKQFGRLKLSGLDLAKPTLFRPPARASAEIRSMLKDVV